MMTTKNCGELVHKDMLFHSVLKNKVMKWKYSESKENGVACIEASLHFVFNTQAWESFKRWKGLRKL